MEKQQKSANILTENWPERFKIYNYIKIVAITF